MKQAQVYKLSNGLNVLLCPRQDEELVCSMLWVNAGYEHESKDILGISHMLEHLYYRKKIIDESGEKQSLLQCMRRHGAVHNAVTAQDHTHFYAVSTQKNFLPVVSAQLQAILSNHYDNEELQIEKAVIFEELKKKLFDPHIQAREALLAMIFTDNDGLKQRSLQDKTIDLELQAVQQFHNRHYQAHNMTLCVHGGFDPEQTINYLEQCLVNFSDIQNKNNTDLEKSKPKKQKTSNKHLKYRRILSDQSQTYCKLGFEFPLNLNNMLVSDLLAIVLGKGKSSVLSKSLGHHAGSTVLHFNQKSVFLLEAECETKDLAQTQETLLCSLYAFAKDIEQSYAFAQSDLQKAKNILYSNYFSQDLSLVNATYKQCYMHHCLQQLSLDHDDSVYLQTLKNIDLKNIQTFIRDFLNIQQVKILELVPKNMGHTHEAEQKMASLYKRIENYLENYSNKQTQQILPEVPEKVFASDLNTQAREENRFRQQSFACGAQLVYCQKPKTQMANLSIRFRGGRLEETFTSSGYTNACLGLLAQATMHQSQLEFKDNLESKGIQLSYDASADHFGYAMTLPQINLQQGLRIISDMIMEPYVNANLLEQEKNKIFNQLSAIDKNLFFRPVELFYQALMGMHPYAWPRYGHVNSIMNLNAENILAWHQEHFCLSNMVVSYVGPASYAQVQEMVLSQFNLETENKRIEKKGVLSFMPPRSPIENIALTKGSQVGFVFGFKGVKFDDSDKIILDCLAHVLSGLGGRLFNELRDKRALVYQSMAYNIALLKAGAFFVYAKTNLKHEEEVKNRVLVEFERLKDQVIPQQELYEAIECAACQHAVDMQAASSLAYLMAESAVNGEQIENLFEYEQKLKKVNIGQINECANKIFDLDHSAIGVLRGKI
ncbi:MAG TPA: pitrilysin family protein [Oligoflexia bacterium]|nr:pitrilysin family protein [Oligoflexia bacterium]HMR24892.1 pitrilysin family protein [Oligoflexia bacterium]